jgi:hypothetical protein
MKKIFLGVRVETLILGTATISMAGSFTWRETRQQGRIEAHREHAWSDGSLNRREGPSPNENAESRQS